MSKVPKEDMQRFINRYKTEMKKKHENGFNQAWMNGSTWFNGRWEDYTDENYKPPEKIYKQNAFRSEKELMEADAHWKMMEE